MTQERESALAKRRKEVGLTQKELADLIGVSSQTISNWEQSTYEPQLSPRDFKKLCEILGWTQISDIPEEFGV